MTATVPVTVRVTARCESHRSLGDSPTGETAGGVVFAALFPLVFAQACRWLSTAGREPRNRRDVGSAVDPDRSQVLETGAPPDQVKIVGMLRNGILWFLKGGDPSLFSPLSDSLLKQVHPVTIVTSPSERNGVRPRSRCFDPGP
ncbi:hypothetical protein AAFF_G00260650 [Aldrovandia affinis]|uniref:Uncharacterized protein n=1 Tax=Aldrovandia affinis TaxID=143900 RepID=A0AAD7W2M5_9TELE|nr:hypothetical protein AAFF_G00260650 [Aldrovandia affinis]